MASDISIFYAPTVVSPVTINLREAREATGLLQLSQRIILRLRTAKGAAAGQPNFGSNLLRDILNGRYRTAPAINRAFAAERLSLLRQSEKDEIGESVRLADLQLLGVAISDSTVTLQLQVTSTSGETGQFDLVA